VRLPPAGREYATWTITGVPVGGVVEVAFDDVGTWHALDLVAGDEYRLLVAGPDATSNPFATVVLALGKHVATIRCIDDDEVIVRDAGSIDVR
jgi:hypothetical protein